MEQLDKGATERVLRAMSESRVDLDALSAGTGIKRATLLRRMSDGPWRLKELGLVAKVLRRKTADLIPDEDAA